MSSTSAFVDSATPPAPRRRRAQIACRNCRRRKIKCVTNEEPPHNPCERCQRKGLVCEYVAVGDPSPPSTPLSDRSGLGEPVHLEPQAYPYGSTNTPHLLGDPTAYGYNPGVYHPGYSAGSQSNHAPLNSTRFPPGPPTAWPSSNLAHSSMLPNQTAPMSHNSHNYAPDYLASSNSHPSQWAQTQDHMRSNAYGTPYYNHVPDSGSQHAGSYTQYDSSTLQCWCRAPTCICGGRR